MNPLRLRRSDAAPGLGLHELWAQVPTSVLTDRDLSDGAVRCYGVIRLLMIEAANRTVCLAPMAEIGRAQGVTEREARRRVAELEARGHVERERVRSIAGSPQGIRPLASLRTRTKRADERTDPTDCNRTDQTPRPDRQGRAPGPNGPVNRTDPAGTLNAVEPSDGENNNRTAAGGFVVAPFAAQDRGEGPPAEVEVKSDTSTAADPDEPPLPTRADFLGGLVLDLAETLTRSSTPSSSPSSTAPPRSPRPRTSARGKGRGSSAKIPPGPMEQTESTEA